MNLVWKYNDFTLRLKPNLVYFDLFFLKINTKQVLTLSVSFICTSYLSVVLVIESIYVVFLTASQFWHHLLNKIFWQNKMLFLPTIPNFFFSLKPETHIYIFFFFCLRVSGSISLQLLSPFMIYLIIHFVTAKSVALLLSGHDWNCNLFEQTIFIALSIAAFYKNQ